MRDRFSPLAMRIFQAWYGPWSRRRLHAVHFSRLPAALPADRPIVLVANHVSWWDGFLLLQLGHRLRPGSPHYTAMLEWELARRPLLRRIGAVELAPGAPSSLLRLLRFLRGRRQERPELMLSFFPQGRIWPSHRRPLGFARGIELVARTLAPATILPVAIHIEPLAVAEPSVFMAAGTPISYEVGVEGWKVEQEVEMALDRTLDLLAAHGELSPIAWAVRESSHDGTPSGGRTVAPLPNAGTQEPPSPQVAR
jgi:hypothetical protein